MTIFLILGIIAALYVIWLIFRAAAYALPVYAGIALGLHLVETGHGYGAAILTAFGAGIAVLLLEQLLLAFLPSTALRFFVVAVFMVPAAFAGYQVGNALGGQLLGQGDPPDPDLGALGTGRRHIGMGLARLAGRRRWRRGSAVRRFCGCAAGIGGLAANFRSAWAACVLPVLPRDIRQSRFSILISPPSR